VEAGNVTHAAELLHVSQPAVSRTLSGLEARLGVQLLRRSKKGVVPTEAGASLYREAIDLLDRLAEVEASASAEAQSLSGPVRIAAATLVFTDLITPILKDFCAVHPGVTIDAALGTQPLDLVAENIDLAVRGGRPGGQEMKFRKLGEIGVALYAAEEYLARHGMPATPEELPDHSLIGSPLSGREPRWVLNRLDGGNSMTMQVSYRYRTDELIGSIALAEAGLGIALVSRVTAMRYRLTRVLPEWEALGPPIFVTWPANRHMPLRVRALLDALIREVPRQLTNFHSQNVSGP
jgi:DNA-binding transcriptional LysR family regulator